MKFWDTSDILKFLNISEILKFQLADFTVASCEGNRAFADVVVQAVDTVPIVQARQALTMIDLGSTVLARVSFGAFAPGSITHRISHFAA